MTQPTPSLSFSLPFPPSGNTYKRHYCMEGRHHRIGVYLTAPAKTFREAAGYRVNRACADQGVARPETGPLELRVRVVRPPGRGLDLDNAVKVAQDVLQGKVYENDRQIKRLIIEDDEAERPEEARLEITVTPYTRAPQDPDHTKKEVDRGAKSRGSRPSRHNGNHP